MRRLFFLSIAIALLATFFASTKPDGLDFVAEKLGFAGRGIERAAPLDYSTAGIAGVMIMLAVFWGSAHVLKR